MRVTFGAGGAVGAESAASSATDTVVRVSRMRFLIFHSGSRMLQVYRDLARLRREHPELTDPSFGHTSVRVDEDARFFSMVRGDLQVVVNFGDAEVTARIGPAELLFETASAVDLVDGGIRVPAHAGALVRRLQA